MTSKKKAIVFVVDRLSSGMLGPYGNTWLEAPNVNRLASRSLLFDFAISDSTLLEKTCRSYWSGLHAVEPADRFSAELLLPALLARGGIESTLLTDDEEVEQFSSSKHFSRRVLVPAENRERPVEEVEDTRLASIIAAAMGQIDEMEKGELLWIHAAGMKAAWDAPLEFRNALADEEDPTPPSFVEPPARMLERDADPDEVLGVAQAYGGQVALLDICLGALVGAIDQQRRDDTLFLLTSPRGFPLGEHRRIGAWDSSLYNESLAVPLMLRVPDRELAGQRSQALVQPADLYQTLLGWFEVMPGRRNDFGVDLIAQEREGIENRRDRACSVGRLERALRTPAWFLRQAEGESELYVKPDDRWEMNNVIQRCPTVAEEMAKALNEFEKCAETGFATPLGTLSDVLLIGLE